MTEQYLNLKDNYSVTHRTKICSVGSIPYNYSCLKDQTFSPKIPENICEILKRNTDYEQVGIKPKYAYQTIHTFFNENENVGYMVNNPLSLDYIDHKEWKKMCDAMHIPELYDFYYEIIRLIHSKDGVYTPAAGLQAIKYDKHGKIIEFLVRNASFDLNVIENSEHYNTIKSEWGRLQNVEQLIGINPFNDNISLETLISYRESSIALTTDRTENKQPWKVISDTPDINLQTSLLLDKLESYGIITDEDKEYIYSVKQPNTKLYFSLIFDSEDNIKEVIMSDHVVEKFLRI